MTIRNVSAGSGPCSFRFVSPALNIDSSRDPVKAVHNATPATRPLRRRLQTEIAVLNYYFSLTCGFCETWRA
jgi:hypothetical protein